MKALTITLIVIIAVLLVAFVVLYFLGRKAEKKQAEQQKTLEANAQTVNLLVIDKKKLKLKEAGLPSIVVEQTPKYMRRTKLPIVKVKACRPYSFRTESCHINSRKNFLCLRPH